MSHRQLPLPFIRSAAAAFVLAGALYLGSGPASSVGATPPAGADVITAAAQPADLTFRKATAITGRVTDSTGAPVGGRTVLLEQSPYPYASYRLAAHTATAPDGSFGFAGLLPDRDTRYRISEFGAPQIVSPAVSVVVEAPAVLRLHTLRYGVILATVHVYHSAALDWGDHDVYWFVAARHTRVFHLVAVTRTSDLADGVTFMSVTFVPPKGPFTYRVCFNTRDEQAVGQPGSHARCPHHDYRVAHAV